MFNTFEVIAGVRAACERLAEVLGDFGIGIGFRANHPERDADPTDSKPLGTRAETVDAAAELSVLLDRARGWWASDAPPAFAPDATSAAEGLLLLALRTLAAYDAPGELPGVTRCRFAELHRPKFDAAAVCAALRCEVAAMARRPAPEPAALAAAVGRSGWWRDSEELNMECLFEVRSRLPGKWDDWSAEERAAWIARTWTDSGRSAQIDQSAEFARSACDIDILNALKNTSLSAARIAKKAGYSERNVKERIALLVKHGLVKKAGARRGYYSPDAPPPDLKFPASER